jgi:thiamine-monophosphate kinase
MTYNTARDMDLDPTLTALSGGEDYELLFTIKQDDFKKIENNADITVIGHITDAKEGLHMISKSGNKHPLKAQGWKAF